MKKTLAVNLIGRVANGLLPFFFLPVYFRYLGPEAYGIYALLLSFQAILGFLDFGLASSVTRELARNAPVEGRATLLATFERSHLVVGVMMALLVSLIAAIHLQGGALAAAKQIQEPPVILWMSCAAFLMASWPLPFYSGALIGSELQIELNTINLVGGVMRYGGGWMLLSSTDLGLSGVVGLQASVSLGAVLLMRKLLVRRMGATKDAFDFDVAVLKRHAPYAIKIFGVLLMGALLSQADKIFLSSLLGLKSFGYYAIAAALAAAVAVAVHPITSTFFPRFVQLHDVADASGMRQSFQLCALLVCALVLAPSTVAIVQPAAVLTLWARQGVDIGPAVSYLPLLMLATHVTMFMTMLQSVHTAGNRPHYIMLANVVQLLVLATGLGFSSVFSSSMVVLGTMVMSPLLGVFVLSKYLSDSISEVSWHILIQPLCFVAAVYLCALLSRGLIATWELDEPFAIVATTLSLTTMPTILTFFVLWRRTSLSRRGH